MTTAAYLRVSSPKHNGQSRQDTRSQKARIKEFATQNGLNRIQWFEDYATGRNANREALQELLQAATEGKVKTILVTELSRLSRSVQDALQLVTTLHKHNVKLVCINQGLTFDRSAMSSFMLAVFAALAELESSIKSERIKAGMQASSKRPGPARDKAKRTKVRKMRRQGLTVTGQVRTGQWWAG
jgi:DNA invertase Pin-like site-specific DNA recombinase